MPVPPAIALAADKAFALPLAVTVRSLLEASGPRGLAGVRVFVVDCGLGARARERLRASWPGLEVGWLELPRARLAGLAVSGHASRASYARLLLGDLLPADVDEVLYLDSDLLVFEDVRGLFGLPWDGAVALAAQDVAAPFVDSRVAPEAERLRAHVPVPDPILNHAALGIPASARYFNSGVLRLDLAAWRGEDLAARCLDCLRRHRDHVRFWDQYALNVVLHGRWGELPPRWNAQVQVHRYPSFDASPYDEATWREVTERPAIQHFADATKPWHHAYAGPARERFFEVLDRTAYAGWRPPRPVLGFDRQRAARSLRKRLRRLARLWPGAS